MFGTSTSHVSCSIRLELKEPECNSFLTTFPTRTSCSRGLELKEILLVQQCVAYALVVSPAANLGGVGEQVLLDKLAIDAWRAHLHEADEHQALPACDRRALVQQLAAVHGQVT